MPAWHQWRFGGFSNTDKWLVELKLMFICFIIFPLLLVIQIHAYSITLLNNLCIQLWQEWYNYSCYFMNLNLYSNIVGSLSWSLMLKTYLWSNATSLLNDLSPPQSTMVSMVWMNLTQCHKGCNILSNYCQSVTDAWKGWDNATSQGQEIKY